MIWWYIIGGVVGVLVLLVGGFIAWASISVRQGTRRRDSRIEELLDPLGEKLQEKRHVTEAEVRELAGKSYTRPMLYMMLKYFERLDLFPQEYLSPEAQAESALTYWMMHPHELQDPPEQIELTARIPRKILGETVDFYVFRYRMPKGHWAHEDGWLVGLAGPFAADDVPYSGTASGFSRCGDKDGEVKPAELIDWYIDMMERKTGNIFS